MVPLLHPAPSARARVELQGCLDHLQSLALRAVRRVPFLTLRKVFERLFFDVSYVKEDQKEEFGGQSQKTKIIHS
jgi:hypothetical protein